MDVDVAGPATMEVDEKEGADLMMCCVCAKQTQRFASILLTYRNPANTCIDCLSQKIDVTEGIAKQVVIFQCPKL